MAVFPVVIEPGEPGRRGFVAMISGDDKEDVVQQVCGVIKDISSRARTKVFEQDNRVYIESNPSSDDEDDWFNVSAVVYDLVETDKNCIMQKLEDAVLR